MADIQKIIVPVDFHQHTEDLAKFALLMAQKFGVDDLTFVHVMNRPVDDNDFKPESLEQLEQHLFAHAEGKMAVFMEKMKGQPVKADSEIVRGETADAILAYTRNQGADLIIISTHGAQGIEKVLLGSVADRVIKGASCPVLVFNPFIAEERGYEVCKPLNACLQSPRV